MLAVTIHFRYPFIHSKLLPTAFKQFSYAVPNFGYSATNLIILFSGIPFLEERQLSMVITMLRPLC